MWQLLTSQAPLPDGVTRCLIVRIKENSYVRKVIGLDNLLSLPLPSALCGEATSCKVHVSESTCWIKWIWIPPSSPWVLLALQLMLSIYYQQSMKCKCEILEMVSTHYKSDILRAWLWIVSSAFTSFGPILMHLWVLGGHQTLTSLGLIECGHEASSSGGWGMYENYSDSAERDPAPENLHLSHIGSIKS